MGAEFRCPPRPTRRGHESAARTHPAVRHPGRPAKVGGLAGKQGESGREGGKLCSARNASHPGPAW